jgi:hypothetical protein
LILRACIDCGSLSDQVRCLEHRGTPRNGSTRRWRKVRAAVLKRDGYRCRYCGAEATTVDHVRPVVSGGTDREDNLVAACADCNGTKGDKTLDAFGSTPSDANDLALRLGLRIPPPPNPQRDISLGHRASAGKNSPGLRGRSAC